MTSSCARPRRNFRSALSLLLVLLSRTASPGADWSENLRLSPHAGPLHIQIPLQTGENLGLDFEPLYTTQTLGEQLTGEQMEKLDHLRLDAPEKFVLLENLFPRQFAEYLLRMEIKNPPREEPLQMTVASPLPREKSEFASPEKAHALAELEHQYSPYQPIGMSMAGNTLSIGGRIVTQRLGAEAAAAGRTPEQLAQERYDALCRALRHWRDGQLTGNAYAGTIKRFLNDARLATFTPEEIHRAYRLIFGRDLKTDLEADRVAAQVGHAITYNELQSRHP